MNNQSQQGDAFQFVLCIILEESISKWIQKNQVI